MYLNKLKLFLE